ncbi:GNAT family N-acetyltransferase [Hyphococcus sp.]|jgi:hypothetical protein|uniref:GNAT family N-acetyltransferase n=1 Tax=Hyphococcus sp. TaxID=2038636 RepID=UPI003D0DDF75
MADETLDIQHEKRGDNGRYWALAGDGEAELTYRMRGDVMVIDHTFTPPEARGKNVAQRLVERAVDEARESGLKIDPVCPYVAKLFQRRPEWAPLHV